MVDWKSSSIQLISGVLGSSLFLFGITTFYTDYLQKPQVEIRPGNVLLYPTYEEVDDMQNHEKNETTITEVKHLIWADIDNRGNAPATEVIVTCLLGDGYIVADKPIATSEEIVTTIIEEPKLVRWKIPRLAADSTFKMEVNVTQPIPSDWFSEPPSPYYKISAAADHGTTVVDPSFAVTSYGFSAWLNSISTPILANAPLIALSVVSVSIIFMPRISNEIKRRRLWNERVKLVSAVYSEIKMVHDTLREDINSKRIFPCKVWYSASSDLKRQVFDNYDDHESINNFFEELEIRDSVLTASSDAFKNNNKELLKIADHVLRKIRWAKYRMINFSVPIAMTTLSAIAVLLGELIVAFLPGTIGSDEELIVLLSTMTIIGAVIAYAFLPKILGIESMFSKSKSNELTLALPRRMKIKLFVLCLIVAGSIPLLSILQYVGVYELIEWLGVQFFVFIGILQISMMFLLVFYAARRIKRSI